MAKRTKVTDRNGDERIIKRSKLRISIITLVILILLTLIGVGIYFIVKAVNKNEISDDNWTVATIDEVRDDILDDEPNEVGIFFYKDDSATTNFMLRNNTVFDDGEQGTGALSEVMAASADDVTWYGVEIPETNELIEELLTVKTEVNGEEEYMFYEDFEYLGAGTALRDDMWILSSLSGTDNDADEGFEIEDKTFESFSFQVQTNDLGEDDDSEDYRDVYFTDLSTDGGGDTSTESAPTSRTTGTKYTISEGTTLLFNGTKLTGAVNSWGTVDVDPEDETGESTETRDDYHDDYVQYLNELVDHNKGI